MTAPWLIPAPPGGNPFVVADPFNLSLREVRALAPIVRFHEDDRYMPMDPVEFIQLSRFRHHRALQLDQGYDKLDRVWRTTNSKSSRYYDIPISVINSYGPHDGKNRRPRDPNRGERWNVFLEPDGNPKGESDPDGVVPTFFVHVKVTPRRFAGQDEPASYVQYWWFHGYNVATFPARHQGDWEYAAAVIVGDVFAGAYMWQHTRSVFYAADELEYHDDHWVAYCALGTHAVHRSPGRRWYPIGLDHTSALGPWMRTWRYLEPLEAQPWRDFAGAWGEVGAIPGISFTTGPLGPWHKRTLKT